MLNDFSIAVENIIFKLGKNIIGNELAQMRIANMAMELYAMVCVLSRTTSILENPNVSASDKKYVTTMTEVICRDSRQNFTKNHKRLGETYDTLIPEVSKAVAERDGYGLDIINF
jgi:acyl-CoA dehydrogenase family protein 9